jgi:hypothetical protein
MDRTFAREEKIVLQDGMYSRTKLPSRNWNRDHGDEIAVLMTEQVQLFRARFCEGALHLY